MSEQIHTLSEEHRTTLLQVARQAIGHELVEYVPWRVRAGEFAEPLRAVRATFVTLEIEKRLRGCIGSLAARWPLVEDVARNAAAAAFQDPRFGRLSRAEFERVELHISILSPAEPMAFASQEDLLSQLRPGVDGLILGEGQRRGTFLPAVWEELGEPEQFLRHLKLKAGLPPDYWSPTVQVWRYTAESVP